jgi:rhodanese-related sulfurtransferase
VLSVGIRPESGLARDAGLAVAKDGRIRVDETLRTSDPAIFAVGDAVEVRNFINGLPAATPLAGPANKQARIAADNIVGRRSIFRGTLGTAVVKVFDLAVASTGCSEKWLTQNGLPFRVSYTHSGSHAGYYPGAESIAVKLVFSPGSGKVLGAQMIGRAGVDKRIDVIATAIRGGMTVFGLEELELAYAPPYGSAKDPVNIAGHVAANLLKGDVANVHWHQLNDPEFEGAVLLDLRTAKELEEEGKIEGARHIPIDELRDKLAELDRDTLYIPYCAVGYRGYVGHRMLVQHGFKSKNLSGGYETYRIARHISKS